MGNASETFQRNRRGAVVAEALHGLSCLWRQDVLVRSGSSSSSSSSDLKEVLPLIAEPPLEVSESETALCEAAADLLKSSLQGVSASHLASCAEVYAVLYASHR